MTYGPLQSVSKGFFCSFSRIDLPVICWSDNGTQFRNIISSAVERAQGARCRTIPASRPQANGLVECVNKSMDGTLMGDRARPAAATLAYNQKERTTLGRHVAGIHLASSAPAGGSWKNLKIREVVGQACAVSDAE